MKLYFSPGACSLAPHIVCAELALNCEAVAVDLRTHKLKESGEDFYKINPLGYVPFLETDTGEKLSEASVILQYLASQKPEANFFPTAGKDLWYARELLNLIATELHKGFGNVFAAKVYVSTEESQKELKANAEKKLAQRFEWFSEHLKGKNFLLGENFTVLDAYFFTIMRWLAVTSIKLNPELTAYKERVLARPAVQKVLKAEGIH